MCYVHFEHVYVLLECFVAFEYHIIIAAFYRDIYFSK